MKFAVPNGYKCIEARSVIEWNGKSSMYFFFAIKDESFSAMSIFFTIIQDAKLTFWRSKLHLVCKQFLAPKIIGTIIYSKMPRNLNAKRIEILFLNFTFIVILNECVRLKEFDLISSIYLLLQLLANLLETF